MITKIEIENFKSIEKATVELGKFNVLIGPNNSGKSNFCSIFSLLNKLSKQHGIDVFKNGEKPDQLVRMSQAESKISISAKVENDQQKDMYKYEMKIYNHPEGIIDDYIISKEIIKRNNEILIQLTGGEKPAGMIKNWSKYDSILSYKVIYDKAVYFNDFKNNIRAIKKYRIDPRSIHESSVLNEKDKFLIEENGKGFPAALTSLRIQDWRLFGNIAEKISKKFTDIEDILSEPTDINGKPGFRIVFKLKGAKSKTESSNISDGITYYLFFLTILNIPDKPSLLIIEEPENAIHPANLEEIIDYIRKLSVDHGTQVIITTHSPYLLDYVKPEEVFVFNRVGDGPTQIRKMADVPDIDTLLKVHTLGELWTDMGEEEIFEETRNGKN